MTKQREVTASVKFGNSFSVEFDEMASAGYLWSAESKDGLTVTKDSKLAGDGIGIGAALTAKFTVEASKPGTYEIDFTYKRPWENEAEAVIRYTLTVKP